VAVTAWGTFSCWAIGDAVAGSGIKAKQLGTDPIVFLQLGLRNFIETGQAQQETEVIFDWTYKTCRSASVLSTLGV